MSAHQFAKSLSHLRGSTARWVVARRPLDVTLENAGPQDLIVWMNANSQAVLAHDLVESQAPPRAVWASFRRAMDEPMEGAPGRPRRIQVTCRKLHKTLQEVASLLGIEVELVVSLPLLDRAFAYFQMAAEDDGFSYLDTAGVTPEMVGNLAEMAVLYHRLAPWEGLLDSCLFQIEGLTPEPLYCSVMGAAGVECGLAVFLTQEGAIRCLLADPSFQQYPGMGIMFQDPEEMSVEVEEHGWALTDDGQMVMLVCPHRPDEPEPRPEEIELAMQVLECMMHAAIAVERQGYQPIVLIDDRRQPPVRITWPVTLEAAQGRKKTARSTRPRRGSASAGQARASQAGREKVRP